MSLHLHDIPTHTDPYEAWWKAVGRLRYDLRQAASEGDPARYECLLRKLREAEANLSEARKTRD
jgi:hypothetical protein